MKPAIRAELGQMLDELESLRLEVVLVPCRIETNIGGCIRCAVQKNAQWYREFCGGYASARVRNRSAFDTCIKRANTVSVLRRLIGSGASRSRYASHLLHIARNRRVTAAQPLAARREMTLKLAGVLT